MKYYHHPHILQRKPPRTIAEHAGPNLNGRLALWITNHVGTMWCAYIFLTIGLFGLFGALTNNVTLTLIFGAISSYVLQLVLLPVIIVGQNLQSAASDARADSTYKDAEAILNEAQQIQVHLLEQDKQIADLLEKLRS